LLNIVKIKIIATSKDKHMLSEGNVMNTKNKSKSCWKKKKQMCGCFL